MAVLGKDWDPYKHVPKNIIALTAIHLQSMDVRVRQMDIKSKKITAQNCLFKKDYERLNAAFEELVVMVESIATALV